MVFPGLRTSGTSARCEISRSRIEFSERAKEGISGPPLFRPRPGSDLRPPNNCGCVRRIQQAAHTYVRPEIARLPASGNRSFVTFSSQSPPAHFHRQEKEQAPCQSGMKFENSGVFQAERWQPGNLTLVGEDARRLLRCGAGRPACATPREVNGIEPSGDQLATPPFSLFPAPP